MPVHVRSNFDKRSEREADQCHGHKRTVQVGKTDVSSEHSVRLFKLAWDLCGEAFGQRLVQYERYYSGDPVRKMGMFYNAHKRNNPTYPRVERALNEAVELEEQV